MIVMTPIAVLGLAFLLGETLADPGGWRAVGLISLWLVPTVVVCVLAWRLPDLATRVLVGIVGLLLVFLVWSAAGADRMLDLERSAGPVRATAVFATAVPLTLLGWQRPREAGALLVLLGILSILVIVAGGPAGLRSLGVLALPLVLTGGLFLLSSRRSPAA
jgi:cell division protein FtsW (lipid II flippase)